MAPKEPDESLTLGKDVPEKVLDSQMVQEAEQKPRHAWPDLQVMKAGRDSVLVFLDTGSVINLVPGEFADQRQQQDPDQKAKFIHDGQKKVKVKLYERVNNPIMV